jgi:hypothetical protein
MLMDCSIINHNLMWRSLIGQADYESPTGLISQLLLRRWENMTELATEARRLAAGLQVIMLLHVFKADVQCSIDANADQAK